MIVEARVIKSFKHTNTGIVWFAGDTFKGSRDSAVQLAGMGYLDFDGHAPEKPEDPELATLTVAELRALCADRGVEAPNRARKADLIEAVRASGVGR